MPFVKLEDIKELITPDAYSKCGNDKALFAKYERLVSIIIRDEAGLIIPADSSDAPDWIIPPFAWIFNKLYSSNQSLLSQEALNTISSNYNKALDTLRQHNIKGSTIGSISFSSFGAIVENE